LLGNYVFFGRRRGFFKEFTVVFFGLLSLNDKVSYLRKLEILNKKKFFIGYFFKKRKIETGANF